MLTAILIISIVILLWVFVQFGATYSLIEAHEKAMKDYIDHEAMRILTAMFNRERMVEAIKNGEEVEI